MTMFANCRKKYTKEAYPWGTRFRRREYIPRDEINHYWEGNLNELNKAKVWGYDHALNELECTFYNDLACDVEECLSMAEGLTDKEIAALDAVSALDEDEELPDDAPRLAHIVRALWQVLAQRHEMHRNILITGMIEGQDDD